MQSQGHDIQPSSFVEVAQGPIREFAQTREPKYRPQSTINLSLGTPQSGAPNLIGNRNPTT